MSRLFRLISYLGPITIHKCESKISGPIDVRWEKGRLALNSSGANYSFNALHRVMRKAFEQLNLDLSRDSRILNLGMGAGSTVTIIRDELQLSQEIISIEIDPIVINLAERFFNVNRFQNHEIVNADAALFMAENETQFDLIIVDLFIDRVVPERFGRKGFLNNVVRALKPNGQVILNHMETEGGNSYKPFFDSLEGDLEEFTFNRAENDILIYRSIS